MIAKEAANEAVNESVLLIVEVWELCCKFSFECAKNESVQLWYNNVRFDQKKSKTTPTIGPEPTACEAGTKGGAGGPGGAKTEK